MPSSAYFLRQADICLRLSLVATDEQVSNRFMAMAQDYKAKAAALASGMGAIISTDIPDQNRAADPEAKRN